MSDITTINMTSRPLELCVKCNAYVPNLKKHTCAERHINVAPPFTQEQYQEIRRMIQAEREKWTAGK